MRRMYGFIWRLSEFTGIGLGGFAPYVFGKTISRNGERLGLLDNLIKSDKRRKDKRNA